MQAVYDDGSEVADAALSHALYRVMPDMQHALHHVMPAVQIYDVTTMLHVRNNHAASP